jgi:hypothetical protein
VVSPFLFVTRGGAGTLPAPVVGPSCSLSPSLSNKTKPGARCCSR